MTPPTPPVQAETPTQDTRCRNCSQLRSYHIKQAVSWSDTGFDYRCGPSVDSWFRPVATPSPETSQREECVWTPDDPDFGTWETNCGEAFSLNCDTPSENGMRFCCYCGKPLRERTITGGDA